MSPADGALSGRQPKAVQSALLVLEEVRRAGVGVTAKEIAERLDDAVGDHLPAADLLVADGSSSGCRTCPGSPSARGWGC